MSDNIPSTNLKVIEVQELLDKVPSSGTREHKELERACVIASMHIESLCNGTVFIQRAFTEDYTGGTSGRLGGSKRIYLRHSPIVSVTSITDDASTTISSTDYTVDAQQGVLEHDGLWPVPDGRWTIIYTAGLFEDTDDVSWDVKEWARIVALRTKMFKGDNVNATTLSGRAGSRSVSRGGGGGLEPLSHHEKAMLAKYQRRTV
jgi:hypothetical protein